MKKDLLILTPAYSAVAVATPLPLGVLLDVMFGTNEMESLCLDFLELPRNQEPPPPLDAALEVRAFLSFAAAAAPVPPA